MSSRALAFVAGLAISASALAQPISNLRYIGQQTLPTATVFGGTQVGGLSGLTYNALTNSYLAISDDRSAINPARFYSLNIDVNGSNVNTTFTGVTTLLQPNGTPYAINSLDTEGIALSSTGTVYVSSEGEASILRQSNPFVNEYTQAGAFVRALPVNSRYIPTFSDPGTFANQIGGVRNNLAFESLTITPDASSLFTATENALIQDGPAAGVGVGSSSRIVRYNLATGLPSGEFLYRVNPVAAAPAPAGSFTTNGLVELLALDNRYLLALERSFSTGVGNAVSLYLIDLQGATDISGINSLVGAPGVVGVQRTLLLDLGTLGITLDNLEALALGPVLPTGEQTLIVLSDNNFSSLQVTQVIALGVTIPTPASGVLVAGATILAARRRRPR
ncbi:MAG: esterase-like activity of phytase family protein [Phycisphaerales bacterium]|nr:esterase-like activity of phytase family protein [Phycisphaerales bacterium]